MTELTTQPADVAARTLVETATGETLFVEAGAGTGKTTALVSRIVSLVREGVPITSIAAITFTEKAASELSEKVRRRLEEAAEANKGVAGDVFRQAIRDLDQAAIQTLHSFAMRILSLYPLEAGLPPQLRLRDTVEATLAFRERWQRFQDELLNSPDLERVLLRGLTVGLRLNDLREVAETFNDNWERLETVRLPVCDEPELVPARVLGPICEVVALRKATASDSLTDKLDNLAGFTEFLSGIETDLRRANSAMERESIELDLLRLLHRVEKLTKAKYPARMLGNAKNWDTALVRDLMKDAETARWEMLDGTRAACICTLLPNLRDFVLRGAEERREQGELEFHDLLVLARNLLRDDAEVRAALHRKFSRILIDEFQDTDPIQVELAALLAGKDGVAAEQWSLAITDPGRLFFVGDPKQSIYRFRRADIELFKRARSAFGSRHVALSANFRCRPGIIEWVNTVCGELFSGFGAAVDGRQADWIALGAGREAARGATVHFLGGARTGDKDYGAAQVRKEEADAIVATIQKARNENWLGRDGKKGTITHYSDIAILLPTRTNSPAIEAALGAAGIPVRVESRSLLFAAQEIRDLTNILAAIDDPTDDVSVVAALRSLAFAVDDGDLLGHVNAGGRWDYTRPAPDQSPEPVRSGMAALAGFHEARWHASIGALVEKVIAERKMLELAVAGSRPRESWRRLRFVSEQARLLGDNGTVNSLRQFVHWLRTQAAEGARIAEAVANEPDDDAVRLLTIHAAKGLEFPIVILAGLGVPPRNWPPKIAWYLDEAGRENVAVRSGRSDTYFETPNYLATQDHERAHGWLERDRLFYVAATRARERLVVSLFHKQLGSDHLKRHLDRKCSVAECLEAQREGSWDVLQLPMSIGPGQTATTTIEDTLEAREAWLAERAERLARLAKAKVVAATALAHDPEPSGVDAEPEPERDDLPWKKGRAGTSVGRAVHAVMQTIDLASGAGLTETASSQAIAEGIADEAEHIARLAGNARLSAPVQAALASGKVWREMYVGGEIEGILVEGFIDMLYESPDGLVIVDYKTDSARDIASIERAMERYRLQGAAYALVLEKAIGRPVAGCVFVFTEPRIDVRVEDLEGAKAEVLHLLRQLLTPQAAALQG